MTRNTTEPPSIIAELVDLIAIITGRRRRKWASLLDALLSKEVDDDEPVRPLFTLPMPLTADEVPYYTGMPLDARGAPHIRSQLASFVAERANIEAGRMQLYSFDDDINARHFIARYERAGVGHLAESHRRKLAHHRALEAEAGHPFQLVNPDIAEDCESEALMQRKYGSPEEDRARIVQYYRRQAERAVAERHGLPSRYSRCEAV